MSSIHAESAQIIGLQFSILSPEEIRRGSVANINSPRTYVDNKPEFRGLFDMNMGVLERGMICPTDGLNYIDTPGYHGHLELAKPVFYIQYLPIIIKCLNCVCFCCSKLLINKEKHRTLLKLTSDKRWSEVVKLCSAISRCGHETEDGCNRLRAKVEKVKNSFASIEATWKIAEEKEKGAGQGTAGLGGTQKMMVTPELALSILMKISDEDVTFMGFSPLFSRPDWMICQTLLIPPPAVRPSVKMDAQQRAEDDLTQILMHIIKANQSLSKKLKQANATHEDIQNQVLLLQYNVATLIDNKMPGVSQSAQRSGGRPLKAIKERLHAKTGRMRGNLMAKRVDFSARSVITADPNLSIREVGVPLKIARKMTLPVIANDQNRAFLYALIANGPEKHPGATQIERANGETITLRYYARRAELTLENGDRVHRHLMDGDVVIFNRQPSLHRPSMMGHIVRVMMQGDTFRMNVADTTPYNADFDGDEMNLHLAQDPESCAEARYLAAVPYNLISPATNAPIIRIVQDSLVGAYLLTRENVRFPMRKVFNMLMSCIQLQEDDLQLMVQSASQEMTSFELLSQIMPPFSLRNKTKLFQEDTEDVRTSNHVIEIERGKYKRGQLEKASLGGSSKGLLHRVCNDFGNLPAADFIDSLQSIVTEYVKQVGFSVGISDLISDKATEDQITHLISSKKVQAAELMGQLHLGTLENKMGLTNEEEFEQQLTALLNQTTTEAGSIALQTLSKSNGFCRMADSGSKGDKYNISQMISCVGQQNVEGKRIGYGFESRTLPHFQKFDDSPEARGFVESSYYHGLKPTEMFFHALAGRLGLIDTAVKTSKTGYIQRKFIKSLEDVKVEYDMTVRMCGKQIIQFRYGDDGMDTVKVENQKAVFISMSMEDIYIHFAIPKKLASVYFEDVFVPELRSQAKSRCDEYNQEILPWIQKILFAKKELVSTIFKFGSEDTVYSPVAFHSIIQNVRGQCGISTDTLSDVTLLEAKQMITDCFHLLCSFPYNQPSLLFDWMYHYYLSPKDLVLTKRFHRKALQLLLDTIVLQFKRAFVAPGEMVGIIAGQSLGEVQTQMTLNTFHFTGVASKSNVTRGVTRTEEIITLTKLIKKASLTIYLPPREETRIDRVETFKHMIEYTPLRAIVKQADILFDPSVSGSLSSTLIEEDKPLMMQYEQFIQKVYGTTTASAAAGGEGEETKGEAPPGFMYEPKRESKEPLSKWIVRLEMNASEMLERNISMDDVNFALARSSANVSCVFSDFNSDKLIFRIRLNEFINKSTNAKLRGQIDQTNQIYFLHQFKNEMLDSIVLRGVRYIEKVIIRKIKDNLVEDDQGSFKKQDIWVLDTVGTNLIDVLALDYVDIRRTHSNDIMEVFEVLGIEAVRQIIYNELVEVVGSTATINYHNYSVLVDRMTCNAYPIAISRHGVNDDDAVGPVARASFEETPRMFLNAAQHAELDLMLGVSANVMCGQEGTYGTSAFQVLLDVERYQEKMMHSSSSSSASASATHLKRIVTSSDVATVFADTVGVMEPQQGSIRSELETMHSALAMQSEVHAYDKTILQDFSPDDLDF